MASALPRLVVFDFDHTVVDANTDTWILRTMPQGLPPALVDSYEHGKWTEYMDRVLQHLHSVGVSAAALQQELAHIPLTAGMRELFSYIGSTPGTDAIIISDSNTLFIQWVLDAAQLHTHVRDVYTNPASLEPSGRIRVLPLHTHACGTCPVNMCKAQVLQQYIDARSLSGPKYSQVAYVGDGGNDLCPVQSMGEKDLAFPRVGYALAAKLHALPPRSAVHPWVSGLDILRVLRR
jgi:pyridoxal phosphate phosphatase PHOSPHO2